MLKTEVPYANNPFLPTQQNDVKISVMLNDGEGGFSLSQAIDLVNDGNILLHDLDNDGYPDIAIIQNAATSSESSCLKVYYNDGTGSFSQYSDFGLVNDPTGELTGQEEHLAQSPVTLSPNPTSGLVRIGGGKAEVIQVYNSLGQWVKTYRNCNEIDLSNLPEGVYTLRISSEEGCTAKRVVKM